MSFRTSPAVPMPLAAASVAGAAALGYTRWVGTRDSSGNIVGRRLEVQVYNAAGDVDANDVIRVAFGGAATTSPRIVDASALGVDNSYILAVAPKAITDTTVGWVAIEGEVYANVDGDTTDVAVGDFLKVVVATNADAFITDGATQTVDSAAVALEANAGTEAVKLVRLLGKLVDID